MRWHAQVVRELTAILEGDEARGPGADGVGCHERARAEIAPSQSRKCATEPMKMHEQMMAEMKAAAARLDGLVTDMHAAVGDAKINAVAAVINELVRQQKAMHVHMGQMHQMGCGSTTMRR